MNLKAFSDIPADARAESARRAASNLKENLGDKADSDPRNAANMALLGSLGSHDLSAMRDVLGMPEKCLASTRSSDDGGKSSWWWTALFQYKGFVAHYEVSCKFVLGLCCEVMTVAFRWQLTKWLCSTLILRCTPMILGSRSSMTREYRKTTSCDWIADAII